MDHSPAAIRPRIFWYAVSLAVLVAGIGLAVWQIRSGASAIRRDARPVRDPGLIRLDRAGSYSLYVTRGASQRMDASADRAWNAAKSAVFVVRDEQTGETIPVRKTYEAMDLQNTLMARLVDFDVPAPGRYVVRIEPSLDVLNPAVRPSASLDEVRQEVMGFVVSLFLGLGIGALAFVIAVTIFLVVLVRRSTCKRRLVSGVIS